MKKNQYKGFFAIENLVVLLVMLLLLLYTLHTIRQVIEGNSEYYNQQTRLDKLVSIADFIVKKGGAEEGANAIYPNWINEQKLSELQTEELAERIGLEKLYVGWEADDGTCLYRLVVVGEEKEIRRLFICGE